MCILSCFSMAYGMIAGHAVSPVTVGILPKPV